MTPFRFLIPVIPMNGLKRITFLIPMIIRHKSKNQKKKSFLSPFLVRQSKNVSLRLMLESNSKYTKEKEKFRIPKHKLMCK